MAARLSARSRLLTTPEVLDSIYTEGSGDEEDIERQEEDEYDDERDLFDDVADPVDYAKEAAVSMSSANATSVSSLSSSRASSPISTHPMDADEEDETSSVDLDNAYEMDTIADEDEDMLQEAEVEDEGDEVQDEVFEEEGTEWVRNTNNFPHIPRFTGNPGIKVALPDDPLPMDIYQLIITNELITSWKAETNRYARDVINSKDPQLLSQRSRFKTWKPVTLDEMRKFLSICMHMGMVKKPTLHDYWTRHPALHSSFCKNVMPRERFLAILAFFHISNNETFIPFDQPNRDPIQKIRPFVTHLNQKFQELYEPERDICLDKVMIPFKGRSRFKVYMKDKPTKWGFKLYEICESKSGYVHSFEIYCADKRLSNKPVDVTMRMMEPLLKQGHRLYLDNYYCCPELWSRLKDQGTMMVGTCRKNGIGMPRDLFEERQRQGQFDYRRQGQLIVTRWTDKREVVTLSSFHMPELRETAGRFEMKEKPLAVIDYISSMARVDHSDQLISFFPMRRKSQKWWKKPFFHLLTLVSIQTTILINKHRRQHRKRIMTLQNVVKELIIGLANCQELQLDTVPLPLARLHERHFIKEIPKSDDALGGRKQRRQCKVCAEKAKRAGKSAVDRKNKRKLTPTWCPDCKVGLCIDCFEVYHTKLDYAT